ncbi:MAG: DMT family transporter [Oscillospiraceae bacterium]
METQKQINHTIARQEAMGSIMLFTTALIWGLAFIAQRVGMDYIGPFTFNTMRCIIGGICLVICIYFINKANGNTVVKHEHENPKMLLLGGFFCGLALFGGMSFQQLGIADTSVANAGFISTLYIVIVPILGLFMGKKAGLNIWIGVVFAMAGLGLLCFKESLSIQQGDLYILISAMFYSFHILIVGYFSPRVDGVKMSCLQFFVAGIFSSVMMFAKETPTISGILSSWIPLLYVGVLSTALGYTFQIIGQKHTDPTIASLLLSLESVFAVIMGWLILGETLTMQEFFGCALVFVSVISAQIPIDKFKKKNKLQK